MRRWNVRLPVCVCCAAGLLAATNSVAEVKAWTLPAGAAQEGRAGWKAAGVGAAVQAGVAIENDKLLVLIQTGAPDMVLRSLPAADQDRLRVRILGGDPAGAVTKAAVTKLEEDEAVVRVTQGNAQADIRLAAGQAFVEVKPVADARAVEVCGRMRYGVLPDFFGNDVVFDPRRYKSDKLVTSAENFLLGLLEGGDAIAMCVWKGRPAPAEGKAAKPASEEREPEVDVFFAGQGKERILDRSRIEFCGQAVFVGLLAAKQIWLEKEISAEPAQKPVAVEWARPFEAKWRADFISKEGNVSRDLLSRVVTWDVTYRSESPDGKNPDGIFTRGGKPVPANSSLRPEQNGVPMACMQGLWPYFLNLAWIDDCAEKDKGTLFLGIYADAAERGAAVEKNNKEKTEARKENRAAATIYPRHPFERVLVYPIDRRPKTALAAITPTDVMRECLGQGPCGYVLDLEGIKGMNAGGSRATLATCGTWEEFIEPFVQITHGKARKVSVNGAVREIAGLKAGEKLTAEDAAFLAGRLEDLTLFVAAVHQRLQLYRTFSVDLRACCTQQVAAHPQLKPLTDAVLSEAAPIDRRLSETSLNNLAKARDEWAAKVGKVIEAVRAGNYDTLASVGAIRELAGQQDVLLSFSRRAVKNVRQTAASLDTADVEASRFATRVGELCHAISRNRHGFEEQ